MTSRPPDARHDRLLAARGGRGPAQLVSVNERVYSAINFAVSNVIYVDTGRSLVVVDTTESITSARATLRALRARCRLPVRYIVYTHFHGDHIRGAQVFLSPSTEVIAQRLMPEQLAAAVRLRAYQRRVTSRQFGLHLPVGDQAIKFVNERRSGYMPPDILVDEELQFREGDLEFHLYHTQGETVDHLMVWLPELRTLCPGDLFYCSFPMLSSPMKPDRPVRQWAESLERMRALRPLHLVPSHGPPMTGVETIDATLANYARAIRFVHDETLQGINEGLPLEAIRARVTLPAELRSLPYLEERYGSLAWAVNGIYRQYTGWYNLDPAQLDPVPRRDLSLALLEIASGPRRIIDRARRALRDGDPQLALELADIVIHSRPRNPAARAVRGDALDELAATAENRVARNIYRTATFNAREQRARCASEGAQRQNGHTDDPRIRREG